MTTRKSLFSKPAWAADPNTAEKNTPIFARNLAQDFAEAERKREEARKVKKEEKEKRKKERQRASEQTKLDENDQPVKKRRISTETSIEAIDSPSEQNTVLKKRIHIRKSETRSSPPVHTPTASSPSRFVRWSSSRKSQTPGGDSDSEDDLAIMDVQPLNNDIATNKRTVEASESDSETDEYIKALNRKIKAQQAGVSQDQSTDDEPIVTLHVKSIIPRTSAVNFEVKPSQKLDKVLADYLERQVEQKHHNSVFFLWNGEKQYGSTTVRTLMNIAAKQSDSRYSAQRTISTLELEAANATVYEHRQKQKMNRLEPGADLSEDPVIGEDVPAVKEKPKGVVIDFKTGPTSDLPDMSLRVRPDSTILHIMRFYKKKHKLDPELSLSFSFDGENLQEGQTVAEIGLEEGDSVEILTKP